MKKIISVLMVAVCLMTAASAQAQIRFGFKGGLNFSTVHFSEGDMSGETKTAGFIGPMVEFTLPLVGFGFDVAAVYSKSTMSRNGRDNTGELKSVEIPINLKWSKGLSNILGVFVAVGPQFGYNVGNRKSDKVYYFEDTFTSFNIGAGVKVLKHIQVGLNYNIGLTKVGYYKGSNGAGDEYEIKNNVFQVSAAYLF